MEKDPVDERVEYQTPSRVLRPILFKILHASQALGITQNSLSCLPRVPHSQLFKVFGANRTVDVTRSYLSLTRLASQSFPTPVAIMRCKERLRTCASQEDERLLGPPALVALCASPWTVPSACTANGPTSSTTSMASPWRCVNLISN